MYSHLRHPLTSASRQRGVIVLTLMLAVLSASSFVILKALNANTLRRAQIDTETKQALMEAKRALIGWSLGYEDAANPDKGPGHLPCPDRLGGQPQGIAEPDCEQVNDAETGRLPFRTLGLSEIKDGSATPLWYAISDVYRSAAGAPLNSETAGTLQVDGTNDVVAVIIAPRAALSGQARTNANYYNAAAYLEDDNASIGDGSFVSAASGDFNDVVVRITRGELMAAVEKRVINEVANALDNYFTDPDGDDDANGDDPDCGADPDCDDGYPWLSTFTDPTASAYDGDVTMSFGHLPLVRAGVPFNADFTGRWDIDSAGTLSDSGGEPPDDSCVRSDVCDQFFLFFEFMGFPFGSVFNFPGPVSGAPDPTWSQGTCTLNDGATSVTCTATMDFTVTFFTLERTVRRVYAFNLADNARIEPPTSASRRQLRMQRTGPWSGSTATLTVTDFEMPGMIPNGSKTLTFSTIGSGDDIDLAGIPFDLEVSDTATVNHDTSPGELPMWFFANNWQRLILARYADAERPGDTDLDCTVDASCLTLNVTRPGNATPLPDNNVRGVVLAAGSDLLGNRPTTALSDYLEANNATVDTLFDKQQLSATFNDQLTTLPLQRP